MAVQAEQPSHSESSELLGQLRINAELRQNAHPSRHLRLIVCTALLAIAGVGIWLVVGGERFQVGTAVASARNTESGSTATLQATGYVTARRQATVSAQITGTLTEVLIEEGLYVRAGQILARLEDTAQVAALEQAKAQFNSSRALLAQYDAQVTQALRDLNRFEDLYVGHLVSQQSLETARTQAQILQAKVESRRREIDLASALVKGAQVQLDYTKVRAPFSGVIIAKAAQVGEIVSPVSAGGGFTRTGIGTIVDMDSLEMNVDVNESYINRIWADQSVKARLDAYPDWDIPSHVTAMIPAADRSKATVKVRIAIDQPDARILPDMGVRVSFLGGRPHNSAREKEDNRDASLVSGIVVPASAITERDGKSFVFAIQDGRARERPVTLGQQYGDLVTVEGVANGTTVVRDPPRALRDDARISVEISNAHSDASSGACRARH